VHRYGALDFGSGTKETLMSRKKVIAARTLGLDQVYHSNNEKKKRKLSFFFRDHFVLP
jgi:hypothetical protein